MRNVHLTNALIQGVRGPLENLQFPPAYPQPHPGVCVQYS
jgi:hypothetical protein